MSVTKLIFLYSLRIVKREWRRFILPLFSLVITTIVLMLVLLLTGSSANFLDKQAKELEGGDVVLESTSMIPGEKIFSEAGIAPSAVSEKIEFSGTLQGAAGTAPFTIEVIDNLYPLYGELVLKNGVFGGVNEGELLLDEAGLKKLDVKVGDSVSFGDVSLLVSGVIRREPTSLFGDFRFFPKAFMSKDSFTKANVDLQLLRAEYTYAARIPEISKSETEPLLSLQETYPGVRISIAGKDQRGLQFGLSTVSNFLVIAVLITAVLAAVNVYASILYLITTERKSLAVLLSLGLTKRKLIYVLGAALGYVVVSAIFIGTTFGSMIFHQIQLYVSNQYLIYLPSPNLPIYALSTAGLIILIAVMSFVPAIRKSLSLNPKQILIGGDHSMPHGYSLRSIGLITISTLVPLIILAVFLLQDIYQGLIVIGTITLLYVIVATLYTFSVRQAYRLRSHMPFFLRNIISQKYADGLFGIISFTSLFVALTALSTLALSQASLERFLINDLSATIPSTYILDVQPSQKDRLTNQFPEIQLFSNIRARIVSIDDLMIQKEIEEENSDISRELGREFSLTARRDLLSNESVTKGIWSSGAPGEISVDENFAKQAKISIGSKVVFLIQGFEVTGKVTSFRNTDSRSGLPFFYFVLSPEDVGKFPNVYFGYSYYESDKQAVLGRFLAEEMPNVSLIDTQSLGTILLQIVSTLMVLVLIVTTPPLLIATLLIAMLVVSSYATRRREGARLRALGMSHRRGFIHYLLDTIFVTLISAIFAYGLGVAISVYVDIAFLKLESPVLFDTELVTGLGLIIFFIFSIGIYLYKTDNMPLRELLSYE